MKHAFVILSSIMLMPLLALADKWTDPDTGIEWTHIVSGGNADLYNSNDSVIPTSTIGSMGECK